MMAAQTSGQAEGDLESVFNERIQARIVQEEGSSLTVYKDHLDNWTIGVGHNMGPDGTDLGVAEFEAATSANFAAVKAGTVALTQPQVGALFASDLKKHLAQAKAEVATFDELPLEVKIAVCDMVFNMGSLTKFADFKTSLANRDWYKAAWDIGHKTQAADSAKSTYYNQVTNRAKRNISLLLDVAVASNQEPKADYAGKYGVE